MIEMLESRLLTLTDKASETAAGERTDKLRVNCFVHHSVNCLASIDETRNDLLNAVKSTI